MESNAGASNEFKKLSDEMLEAVSGGVDLSNYTKEDLAAVFEYFGGQYGRNNEQLAAKLSIFGATVDDIKQAQRSAVAGGSTSFWPYYLADMLLERYA